MHFLTAFTSFSLMASMAVIASPVAHPAPAPAALTARQTISVCLDGLPLSPPCIIQDEINDCANDVNNAYALVKAAARQHIDDARLAQIKASLESSATGLEATAVELATGKYNDFIVPIHDRVNDVVVAIKETIPTILNLTNAVQVSEIVALANQTLKGVTDVEYIIGYCKKTTSGTPTLGPVSDVSSAAASPTATPSVL